MERRESATSIFLIKDQQRKWKPENVNINYENEIMSRRYNSYNSSTCRKPSSCVSLKHKTPFHLDVHGSP